ncbi:type VII secretion target [Saccharothrix coeruleofusca]|uniref:Excreted virulence factor EspC (Type VII ESX diderm) n=1 Tax=Saccharothrix coeruleofusca TaxID=33919 RepID=A0A918EDA5_9PSEU|nr:type VII secretion target [Saccharothrix coeruleofusca]GGP55710.1 hypothetical protein GCM10010185_30360 [Saccharothrix coeruleofusca]
MTGAFSADPERLRAHASGLAGYADRLAATGARLPDGLGEQSLGAFTGFLTAGLGAAMAATLDAFTHAASTVDAVGTGLRRTAEDYQRTDDDQAAGFARLDENAAGGAR